MGQLKAEGYDVGEIPESKEKYICYSRIDG
jgi:hypothetical protein